MTYPTVFDTAGQHARVLFESENLTGGTHAINFQPLYPWPRRLIVEYFLFLNTSDAVVTPTGGTVAISTSLEIANGFHYLDQNANFNAADAHVVSRLRPQGIAIANRLRVNLDSIAITADPYKIRLLLITLPV